MVEAWPEALIGDDALSVGPVTVSWLDADRLTAVDYRLEMHLWPEGRLVLRQLGRRFDTFTHELRRVRNQARVAGMLAHGITMPDVYEGAVLAPEVRPAELRCTTRTSPSSPRRRPMRRFRSARSRAFETSRTARYTLATRRANDSRPP